MRQHEIYQQVQRQGACSIVDLARSLNVSGETIRRNVRALSDAGLVVKVHGGISLPMQNQEPPIMNRMRRMVTEKKRIAEAVAQLIEPGDSVILDTGSTTAFCAQALQAHDNLTVITNSSYISNLLASRNGNKVFMAGGELRSHDAAAFGPSVIDFVRGFHADKSVLSIGAIHETAGCMNYELCEAELSRVVIESSNQVILASDASKFGNKGLARVCGFEAIDHLVTDSEPASALKRRLREFQVELTLAPTATTRDNVRL